MLPVQRLPEDAVLATKGLPLEVVKWMTKTGLNLEDVQLYDIHWSPSRKSLIFPLTSAKSNMFAFQERMFDGGPNKWMTYGPIHSDVMWLTLPTAECQFPDTIVLVEDVVSAIRVGHVCDVIPLVGTHFSLPAKNIALDYYTNVVFWLDKDALGKSLEYARQASILGVSCHSFVIGTDEDPKMYTKQQIATIIANAVELAEEDE